MLTDHTPISHITLFKNEGTVALGESARVNHGDYMVGVSNNINEPPRGKTNNVVSEQVRHKQACTSTEKS